MPDNRARPRPPQHRPPRSASRRKRERRRDLTRTQSQPGRRVGRLAILGGALVAVGAVVLLVVLLTRGSAPPPPTTQTSPTPTPVPTPTAQPLASLASSASGSPVDGMQCASSEPTTNRFTAHLAVFVGGSARQIPAGVGIASPSPPIDTNAGPFVASGKCYYPLLTHTSDGIVQISMPAQAAVTLGNFFDIWGQPLTTGQVGPATGSVIVYVNGSKYTGDPRALTIAKHALIQLDVGMDTPPVQFAFPPGD